jgi:hypothetical protein
LTEKQGNVVKSLGFLKFYNISTENVVFFSDISKNYNIA